MKRNHNHFKTNFEELAATKFLPFYNAELGTSFEKELAAYKEKIEKKVGKQYGKGCALVVFHMGLPWEWEEPAEWENPNNKLSRLRTEMDYSASPFDRGVWFVSWERVYRLDKGTS